jgi:23S rRNA (cytidine1920-2'-O)/16S rRNA (cytidine1409-2'-O)-methyltransferase
VIPLIKPQFEVGREHVGKGGIVRDEGARQRAVDDVIAAAGALGWRHRGLIPSPIAGADGNVEYLARFDVGADVSGGVDAGGP